MKIFKKVREGGQNMADQRFSFTFAVVSIYEPAEPLQVFAFSKTVGKDPRRKWENRDESRFLAYLSHYWPHPPSPLARVYLSFATHEQPPVLLAPSTSPFSPFFLPPSSFLLFNMLLLSAVSIKTKTRERLLHLEPRLRRGTCRSGELILPFNTLGRIKKKKVSFKHGEEGYFKIWDISYKLRFNM